MRLPTLPRPLPRALRPRLARAAAAPLLALCVAPPTAARAGGPSDVLPFADVRPGMTGWGLTVFSGAEPDTFRVRVLGVQRHARPGGNVILVELEGPGLDLTAIPQGMSGSPVWLGGRFAGAVAFSWEGALRPIGGLTPADELLALPDAPAAARQEELGAGATDGAGWPAALLAAPPRIRALAARLFGLDARDATPAPAAPTLSPAWPAPEALAARLLEGAARPVAGAASFAPFPSGSALHCRPVVAGAAAGAATAASPAPLRPGSACAVALVLGDAELGAIGTVSWVDGERVLIFGHPLLQAGPVELPLVAAEEPGVNPSRQMSFKMGGFGPVVGAVHHDLRAGLAGRLGARAPLVPVTVTVIRAGGEPERFVFAVGRDPRLSAALVQWCLYGALLAGGDDLSRQTVRWSLDARWRRADGVAEPCGLAGAVAGPNGVAELAPEWVAPLQALYENRHAPLRLEAVDATLRVEPGVAGATIAAAEAPAAARPGETWPVTLTLQPRRGAAASVRRSLALPAHLPPGDYRLLVASSRDVFALEAQRAQESFADRSLAATLAVVRAPRSPTDLEYVLYAPGRGVTVDGRELAELPGSVAATLQAEAAGRVAPVRADIALRERVPGERILDGAAILPLTVLPPATPARPKERP